MEHPHPRFLTLTVKAVMSHTITYFVMGLLAFHFLHYADFINKPNSGMRPVSDPLVVLGPALQVLRGVLFALVFYPFREVLFTRRSGWLLIAWMLIGVGILGTFAAAPGSFEGFIYTTVPVRLQVRGYLEIVPQALLLSGLLFFWVRHPQGMAELRTGRGLRDLPNSSGSRANRSQVLADIALFGPLPHDIQLRLVATRSYAGGPVQREHG